MSLISNHRRRKLRDALTEETVGGKEYERRLRRQFEKINPTPSWADKARRKLSRKAEKTHDSEEYDSASDSNIHERILSATDAVLDSKGKNKRLESGTLAIERLRDANQAAAADGSVKSVHFHPSPTVPVLLAASSDRMARMFNVIDSQVLFELV